MLDGVVLDVGLEQSDLSSVREFTTALRRQRPGGVDGAVLCAGIEGVPDSRTTQGLEQHYGINVVSHFALAAELVAAREPVESPPSLSRSVASSSSAA